MNITGDNMPEGRNKVLARGRAPSENSLREAFATGLAKVQGFKTDQDAADLLGWSVGSVRNVRNRSNTISAKLLSDAWHNCGDDFFAPFMALHDKRPVRLADVLTPDQEKARKLSAALTALLEIIGDGITDDELMSKCEAFEAGKEALFELCARARRAALRVAA